MAEQLRKRNIMDNIYGIAIGGFTGVGCYNIFNKVAVAVTGSSELGIPLIAAGTVVGVATALVAFQTASVGSSQLGTFRNSNDNLPTHNP